MNRKMGRWFAGVAAASAGLWLSGPAWVWAAELANRPEQILIPRATQQVNVDGALDEWPTASGEIVIDPTAPKASPVISWHHNHPDNPIQGAADLSARAWLSWDDTYLYVAASVTDDDLKGIKPDCPHNVGPPGWGCDSVMIQLHSFRKPMKTNTPYTASPNMALRYEVREGGRGALQPNDKGQLDTADANWKLPEGSRLASRETQAGYDVEAAIPWAALEFPARAGEVLYVSFLLGDIDTDEALNQLGWNFREPRLRPVFRLDDGAGALGLLTLGREAVTAGGRVSVRYQADALVDGLTVRRLAVVGPGEHTLAQVLDVAVPQGQRAEGLHVFDPLPSVIGEAVVRLEAERDGRPVVLAQEALTLVASVPDPPLVRNPAGEISRPRPDRIAHSAEEEHGACAILRHGFVTGREGYERYLLTHVRDFVEKHLPVMIEKNSGQWIGNDILMAFVLLKLTGEPKYAEWVRRGLEVAIAYQTEKHDSRQLRALMELRHFIWQREAAPELVPPGIEEAIAAAWRHQGEHPEDWLYTEWGYHNRCWHRWCDMKLIKFFTEQAGGSIPDKMREYLDWHDARMVKIGGADDNSAGYNWLWISYPVLMHMATGTLDQFAKHPGYLETVDRYRQYSSPSGAVPHFGDTSGWLTGVGPTMPAFEMMSALTRDGHFRWQAHRIAEYLYNHFWPRHDQYHGPRDDVAGAFARAWLWADDSVAPVAPSPRSRMAFRPRVVEVPEDEKATRPGYVWGKVLDERTPDKLILSSGNDAQSLWGMVELLEMGGHSGRLPGHFITLLRHDAALLAGQGYFERSQDFNNVVWVEDLEGVAADPRPMRTAIPRFVEDAELTYVRVHVLRYGGLPVTAVRDIVFVKNGFVLVRDRLTFHATMKVRVGPCWQTRNLGPACDRTWFNTYYDQLYHTGLGLGRGVHSFRNPAWDLLVSFSPRDEYRQSVLDRYDDNPYRVSPVQLRQYWTGIIGKDESRTFTTVLAPHAPAFDVTPYVEGVRFVVDRDDAALARVYVETDTGRKKGRVYWLQLGEEGSSIEAEGWKSDARLALVRVEADGRVVPSVMVEGSRLEFGGEDLTGRARSGAVEVVHAVDE